MEPELNKQTNKTKSSGRKERVEDSAEMKELGTSGSIPHRCESIPA